MWLRLHNGVTSRVDTANCLTDQLGWLCIGLRILAGINTRSMEAPPEFQLDQGETRRQ